ncbi:Fe2+-enterobactin ABC transporter substrate-binding protein [Mangrovicoccus algicola]|uniref:Fe2+-enterobactin ABC transporter substrate-binding protein n=1 Tax=Mangrovicoccus algicola TaxID=2771008 RepID=A0A8J7CHR5_9RHOB|nr:Fe2+-enterobactin ABC transporter substrate-binding protein [Mangrovicoccus algicola]MBE3638565.1 Fe2+-enterobactin ABC transporter substrate-binding protein [Mangrovicoccus algicola]
MKFPSLALIAGLLPLVLAGPLRAADWPRQIPHAAGTLTLEDAPEIIVSTTPSVTGILLAIGAPVAASAATTPGPLTDDRGFFSQWAAAADAQGVEVLYPNLGFDMEAIIGWWPDLVVASTTGADSILPHLPALQAQGVPTIAVDYAERSWQDLARDLGRATGHEAGAEEAIRDFDRQVAGIAAGIAPHEGRASIVGYKIADTYSIGKPASAQAQLLAALGFEIAGLPERLRAQVTRSSNFDFISRENLGGAITGETVFLLNGTADTVRAFLADPVLANLPAVQKRQVYGLGQSSFRIDYYSGLQTAAAVAAQFAAR